MTGSTSDNQGGAVSNGQHTTSLRELERQFRDCGLVRPFRRSRYDTGDHLVVPVLGVAPAHAGRVVLEIERFVGGGFAGQVYRARLVDVRAEGPLPLGLEPGRSYALKILVPPSGFANLFRDFIYFLAFQGPFSARVNPSAVRVGVLWQKLIRRAAEQALGEVDAVCDTYATFYDEGLLSFGEINEWVDARIWKFEVDDELFDRWKFEGQPPPDANAAEYVNKKLFMRELVELLHAMGAPELARQYEWWTCKSQPNVLKRRGAGDDPRAGLTALDFRAGLALLPFLPMSPADFGLILRGLFRGRLVQFDRGDPRRLRRFFGGHEAEFADLGPALDELEQREIEYRRSLPDITHHHFRLLFDPSLRASVKAGTVTAWRHLGRIDEEHARRLREGMGGFPLLAMISLVPLIGPRCLAVWGDTRYREHVKRCLTSWSYLMRALRGGRIETLINWNREDRAGDERALRLVDRPVRYGLQRLLLGWLPARWHRALAEPRYAWDRLRERVRFGVQFLRVPSFREQWLEDQVRLGHAEGMLTAQEATNISAEVRDPYIQKYLRCSAVHLCTAPITKVTAVLVAAAVLGWMLLHDGRSWAEAMALATAATAVVTLLPISPGSIARGVFVVYLMVRERDIRNYYIAAPVAFLHVVGYLAFPMQMLAHNPALSRFLAGRWARNLARYVPIFGESGALLEHATFDLSFNYPLSVKRRFTTHPVKAALWTLLFLATLAAALYTLWLLLHHLTIGDPQTGTFDISRKFF